MGYFPAKRPIKHSGRQPIKVGKRPIEDRKCPIKANGLFSGTPPWWKTVPLKRPMKRSVSMSVEQNTHFRLPKVLKQFEHVLLLSDS